MICIEFRNFQALIPPAANKSESVQKSQPIEIVNIFKLTNHNKIYGLIYIDSLKIQISQTTPQISPTQSRLSINQSNEQIRD